MFLRFSSFAQVKATLGRLEGTWGLAILHKDHPDQIIAARNGSPLLVGLGANNSNVTFVASEACAFSRHTSQFISLKDGYRTELFFVVVSISPSFRGAFRGWLLCPS